MTYPIHKPAERLTVRESQRMQEKMEKLREKIRKQDLTIKEYREQISIYRGQNAFLFAENRGLRERIKKEGK